MASRRKGDSVSARKPPSLRVPQGETVLLSPESDRFKENYRTLEPRTAQELRELIGLSEEGARTARGAGVCCQSGDQFAEIPSPGDLDSEDEMVRWSAFDTVGRALRTCLRTPNPKQFALLEPAIARYLELMAATVNLVTLNDVHVANGATLTISTNTHLLEANKVVIEGTGKIDGSGYMKLKVTSIEGI
jgi:hypothetical protein